jgi:hypothetical protein
MRTATAFLALTLPITAALVPSPLADAATIQDPVVVVEIDRCVCLPILKIEPWLDDTSPWTISWSREEGSQYGRCPTESCTLEELPRPCKAQYRIEVTWPGFPTAPCISEATVAYQQEGEDFFRVQGTLDLTHAMIPIPGAGGDPVKCRSGEMTTDPLTIEPDSSRTVIRMNCVLPGTLSHQKFAKVREACKTCQAGS